jgi:hypothetical protein
MAESEMNFSVIGEGNYEMQLTEFLIKRKCEGLFDGDLSLPQVIQLREGKGKYSQLTSTELLSIISIYNGMPVSDDITLFYFFKLIYCKGTSSITSTLGWPTSPKTSTRCSRRMIK